MIPNSKPLKLSKSVKNMTSIKFLRQDFLPCKEGDIEVLVYEINGKEFYNATHIWKASGEPKKDSPSLYLNLKSAREMVVCMYREMHKKTISQEQASKLRWNTDIQNHFVFIQELEDGSFEHFFAYSIFLDYCTILSTQLKLAVFQCIGRFGNFANLEGKDLANAFEATAESIKAKMSQNKPQ